MRRSTPRPLLRPLSLPVLALAALPWTQRAPAQEETDTVPAASRVRVVRVGTLHPVSAPAIRDGVLVVENGRLTRVGPASSIEVPEGAEVHHFPDGHAYPGLVDALSRAFGDEQAIEAGGTDAGMSIAAALDPSLELSRRLVAWGVTTTHVSNRGDTAWRGRGVAVHPRADGFERCEAMEEDEAPVHMRLAGGDGHPLARQKRLREAGKPFEELEEWQEKKEEHAKALEKYAEDFEKWLAWHREKKDEKEDDDSEASGEAKPASTRSERRGRPSGGRPPRGGSGGQGGGNEKEKEGEGGGGEPSGEEQEQGGDEGGEEKKKKEEKPPERPKYPDPPPEAPDKEALLAVTRGGRALHVAARERDEIEAALALRGEHELPRMVLEGADEAAAFAERIAAAGIPVVVSGAVPAVEPDDPDGPHPAALAGTLQAAGVTVAIGSHSVAAARHLPLMAARAAGHGLPADRAVAAITLAPAQILGIADAVGSLEPGKRADVLVTSAPLLRSDARVLLVLSGGEVEHRETASPEDEDR